MYGVDVKVNEVGLLNTSKMVVIESLGVRLTITLGLTKSPIKTRCTKEDIYFLLLL